MYCGGGYIYPNQELIAHGPANILSGLFGGFLVVGSLSKTSVAIGAGARSQVANLIAAVFCFLTLVLLTPLFRGLPHAALPPIVIGGIPSWGLVIRRRARGGLSSKAGTGRAVARSCSTANCSTAFAMLTPSARALRVRSAADGPPI